MFEKGRKRESKGLAVLYFIIGLIILLIILGVIYFALVKLDYSDQISDPSTPVRSYVNATAAPTEAPEEADVEEGDFEGDFAFEGMTGEDASAEDEDVTEEDDPVLEDEGDETGVSAEVIQTATPSPTPTPTPTPSPTPSPTPKPTRVPASKLSKSRTSKIRIPAKASAKGVIGITECEVYAANKNSVMRLNGYGYVNTPKFNGKKAKSYMVVTQRSNGKQIAYQLKMKKGISHRPHKKAKCKNAAYSDYQMYINVKKFRDDIYSLALVIAYTPVGSSKTAYAYYPFSSDVSFTVLDGKVVTPVNTVK